MTFQLRCYAAVAAMAVLGAAAGGCDGGMAATAEPTPLPDPISLTVLHTNDNWGETKPCG
jgi:hypothetical protein